MKGGLNKRWWNYLKYLKCFGHYSVVEAIIRNAVKINGKHQSAGVLPKHGWPFLDHNFALCIWIVSRLFVDFSVNCKLVYTRSKRVIKHLEFVTPYIPSTKEATIYVTFLSIFKFLWTISLKNFKSKFCNCLHYRFFFNY